MTINAIMEDKGATGRSRACSFCPPECSSSQLSVALGSLGWTCCFYPAMKAEAFVSG